MAEAVGCNGELRLALETVQSLIGRELARMDSSPQSGQLPLPEVLSDLGTPEMAEHMRSASTAMETLTLCIAVLTRILTECWPIYGRALTTALEHALAGLTGGV